MIVKLQRGARKLLQIVGNQDERWRLVLLRNKRQIQKLNRSEQVVVVSGDVETDALMLTARTEPAALQLAVRKLWRAGSLELGLSLVDEVWAAEGQKSGAFALACAKTWFQYGRTQLGDVALSTAKRLLPAEIEIYSIEATTHSRRGNVHTALSAAETALRLSRSAAEAQKWRVFLGEQSFRLDQHEAVVEYLQPLERGELAWKRLYELAVSLGELGREQESREAFAACAAKAVPSARRGSEIAELHFKAERHRAMLDELEFVTEGRDRNRLRARALLSLGMFEACAEFCLDEARTPQLAEYGALALELAGKAPEALRVYRELLKSPVSPKRRPFVLRRHARAAFALGDHSETVRAEMLHSGVMDTLERLDREVNPAFRELGRTAQEALRKGSWGEALAILRQLELSASSWSNIARINRAIGVAASDLPDLRVAAEAFNKCTPFPLPNVGEANAKPTPLRATERYFEFSERSALMPEVILYESFYGAKTACNPLALCLSILNKPEMDHFHHVWVVKDGAPIHRELLGRKNVHFVRYLSDGYMLRLATAGTVITNSTFPRWFTRREGQRYANTWHGVPWKHMGRDVEEDAFSYENVARNFLQSSDLLFPNAFTAETLLNTQDVRSVVSTQPKLVGSPRIDRMLRSTSAERGLLLERLGLSPDRPVVLYAPTWRGTMGNREQESAEIFEAVRALSDRRVHVLMRAHYFTLASLPAENLPQNLHVPDESIDSNELLAIADLLITDYSSIIFDYAVLNRPIIKHVYDLDEYTSRRGLYFDVDDVPGSTSHNCSQLAEQVDLFLNGEFGSTDWSGVATSRLWTAEDGRAAERSIDTIFGPITRGPVVPAPLLVSMNSLNPNGITRSFSNLVKAAAPSIGHVQAMLPTRFFSSDANVDSANRLRGSVDFTLRSSLLAGTRQEQIAWRKLAPLHESFPEELLLCIRSRMKSEFRRLFGETKFQAVVDFDGHDLYSAALAAFGPGPETERVYVGHNEFCAEMYMRFPNHRGIGTVLRGFSKIASVSEAVRDTNAEGLNSLFGVPTSLHTVLQNTLNVDEIREQSTESLDQDLSEWFSRPGKHLIMIGRLSPEKNHQLAFEALSDVRGQGEVVDILVLGDGPLRVELEQAVDALGLNGSVFFAGQRPNPYAALARADGLLLSSKHEGQPMVFLEAMTLGVPIAASRIPASVSTLEEGKHGLLVELDRQGIRDAISALNSGDVPSASFDGDAYLERAVGRFLEVISAPLAV